MKFIKFFTIVFVFLFAAFLFSKSIHASNGTVELVSTNRLTYRCVMTSLQLENGKFRVVINCRDLIYPVDGSFFTYLLWINPTDGSAPRKLGTLGLGRKEFVTDFSFSSAFVTTEINQNVKEPSTDVVMRGNLQGFLLLETAPTDIEKEIILEATPTIAITTTPTPSARDRLFTGLKRAGLAFALALFAGIGVVFVITRGKR
jgi:hypothetical protein